MDDENLNILINRMFFKKNTHNLRNLISFLTYFVKNFNNNKKGTIKWFCNLKISDRKIQKSQDILNLTKKFGKLNNENVLELIEIIDNFYKSIKTYLSTKYLSTKDKMLIQKKIKEWYKSIENKQFSDFGEDIEKEIKAKEQRKKKKKEEKKKKEKKKKEEKKREEKKKKEEKKKEEKKRKEEKKKLKKRNRFDDEDPVFTCADESGVTELYTGQS